MYSNREKISAEADKEWSLLTDLIQFGTALSRIDVIAF